MSLKRFARISIVFATVLGAAIAAGTLHRVSPVQAAQAATEPCCGVITSQGQQLVAVLDSMNVEKRWLAHEHINWETGEADEPATYNGPGKSSHCSAFTAAVGERLVWLGMPEPGRYSCDQGRRIATIEEPLALRDSNNVAQSLRIGVAANRLGSEGYWAGMLGGNEPIILE